MTQIDRFDRQILAALQRDGRQTAAELANDVALSASQCARRRQRLEEERVITGYQAVVDPARIGLPVRVFVQVVMAAHSARNAADFEQLLIDSPTVLGAYFLTGDADYLLDVAVPDLDSLHQFLTQTLLTHPAVARVETRIMLKSIKHRTAMPVV